MRSLCNDRVTVLFKAFAEDAYSYYGFQFSEEENTFLYLSCPLQSHLPKGFCSACIFPYLDLFLRRRGKNIE